MTSRIFPGMAYEDTVRQHYEQALKHDARIIRDLGPTEYGSIEYVCADPEGHYWGFGSYLPPAEPQEMLL